MEVARAIATRDEKKVAWKSATVLNPSPALLENISGFPPDQRAANCAAHTQTSQRRAAWRAAMTCEGDPSL